MATVITKSIKIKDVVGNPAGAIANALSEGKLQKNADGTPVEAQTVVLGYVYGRARERFMHKRNIPQPSGEVKTEQWPALRGEFECVSVDPKRDAHRSPVLFLQEHLIDSIGSLIESARSDDTPEPIVNVAFEIQAKTSKRGTAGFEWQLVPRMELKPQNDPLAEFRQIAMGSAPQQIQAPDPANLGNIDPTAGVTGGEPPADAGGAADDTGREGAGTGTDTLPAGGADTTARQANAKRK